MKPLFRLPQACIVSLGLLAACSTSRDVPARTAPQASDLVVSIVHRDGSRNPTLVWLSNATGATFATAREAGETALAAVAPSYHLRADSLVAVALTDVQTSGDITTVHFTQRANGREVFRSHAAVLVQKDNAPIAFSGTLAASLLGSERAFALTAAEILTRISGVETSEVGAEQDHDYRHFESPRFARPARIKEVYFDTGAELEPAYQLEVFPNKDSQQAASAYVVSAIDGRVLFQTSLVRYEQATYRVWADPTTLLPMDGPQGNAFAPRSSGRPDGTRITPVASQLVTLDHYPFSKNDPWLSPGATTTSGNNVRSYGDRQAPDGYSDGTNDVAGEASSAGVFDWTSDLLRSPASSLENIRAGITHQFYVINFMHDWFYDAGFDEKSGNPQANNYGRGGRQGDAIDLEGQDFSGRNNANAQTPSDGAAPTIQMYIFSGRSTASFSVTDPASIAGAKPVGLPGEFGSDSFDISGPVVLGVDGSGADANDACEPLRNDVTDQIVLVHRGTCSFVDKARNVQAAGARAMVLRNVPTSNTPNSPPFMGGSGPGITIPCVSLAQNDGAALETAIGAGGASITVKRALGADVDGALDTQVVAHEWGHILSNRLIGNGVGLNTNQAGGLGEGWSDFIAMLLIARPDDLTAPGGANWSGVYPMGSYAMSGSTADAYFGIRRVPYSVDFSKNAYTYKHISEGTPLPDVATSYGEDGNGNAEVHATGEVWASMLWECYVALLRDSRLTFVEAQTRMKKYLVAGMKMTPVSPTILEARDALLAAVYAADEKDYALFWQAFARRGAGIGAQGPDKQSADNRGVVESFFAGSAAEIVSAVFKDEKVTCDRDGILDDGEVGSVELTVRNSGIGTLRAATIEANGPSDFAAVEATPTSLGELKPFQSTKVTLGVRTRAGKGDLTFNVVVRDPALDKPYAYPVTVLRNVDEAPDSSAIDLVDTLQTSWTTTKRDRNKATKPWSIVKDDGARYWSVPNGVEPSDISLISPAFSVAGTRFGLSFKHRFGFESSAERMKDFDGGVVEVTLDGGKTWKDASEYGAVNYNVTLDNDMQGTNPLKGRRAFGNRSPGYPAWITTSIALDIGAAATAVQVRFRAGADDNAVDKGWDVDDIKLTDIGSTPFWSLVPHGDACDENGPRVNAGPNQQVNAGSTLVLSGTGTHPNNLPITFSWVQESGPAAVLSGESTASLTLVAPQVTGGETLVFALRGQDGALVSPASRVTVTVSAERYEATGGCSTTGIAGNSGWSLLALLGLWSRKRRR
jgi:large repetitive protein